jgi:hypothetical protein
VEPAQTFYNQPATHFRLPLFLRGTTEVDGRLIVELAESFLSQLLFPGTRVTALHTKRARMGTNLNMGDFTSARWKGAQKKLLDGDSAVTSNSTWSRFTCETGASRARSGLIFCLPRMSIWREGTRY